MKQLGRFLLVVLMPLATLVAMVRYAWAVFTSPARALVIAVAFDRMANAALNGDGTETISSRAARARDDQHPWACVLCRVLDWLDNDHCNRSRGH